MMATIRPFNIAISEERWTKLRWKLEAAEFPDEVEESEWTYGASLKDVKRLVAHWKDGFDWRAHEDVLNELPQFTTEVQIDGFGAVSMHFVHQQSEVKGAIPLLFVHGWPGSFLEVTRMLPLLRGGEGRPAFHVVAPSLPNFAFSGAVKKPGFSIAQYAESCHKVMQALGYEKYVTQGGDWGFTVTRALGLLYPNHCKAIHTNFPITGPPKNKDDPSSSSAPDLSSLTPQEQVQLARTHAFAQGDGRGYLAIQSTKPQTCAYFLRDSPVAVLAWIYDKLHDWTDNYAWTDDEVLLWVSVYWFSRAGPHASAFIYYEAFHEKQGGGGGGGSEEKKQSMLARAQGWVDVPLAVAYFPREIATAPESWVRANLGPVKQVSHFERGGHFASWEMPKELAGDVCKLFGKEGPLAGVIEGKPGYDESATATSQL